MKEAILILSVLVLSSCGHGINYSDGERVGVVTKLSYKGVFCKTWEGQMNLGGMATKTDGSMVPNVWDFTVENLALLPQIQKAMSEQTPLKIAYHQGFLSGICTSDSDYFVESVK